MAAQKSWHISRRTLLRGTGATLALPWLEAMAPAAKAAGQSAGPPLRMGIYSIGAGTVHESWKPSYTGALQELPSILQSMEPHKEDMLLLTGLSHSQSGSHGVRTKSHLTGSLDNIENKPLKETAPGMWSVDQVAARAVGANTFLPSLEMGNLPANNSRSYRDSVEVPREPSPTRLYERMFRNRSPRVPNWDARASSLAAATDRSATGNTLQKSALDLISEEAKSLQRRLGTQDQQKLDQYLTSVRSVEKRIEYLEREAAVRALDRKPDEVDYMAPHIPEMIADGTFDYDQLRKEDKFREADIYEQYMDLLGDLMVLAFQTDTTRVVTLMHEGINEWSGIVTVGFERHWHTLQHTGSGGGGPVNLGEKADPIAREGQRQVHEWFTRVLANTVGKMKEIDEGGSSLLDNTLLLYTSYMANGGHGNHDFPTLLVGNAQGTLKTGRHVAYPMDTPTSNLYVEMLHRMGVEVDEFGESKKSPNARFNGRLPDLV